DAVSVGILDPALQVVVGAHLRLYSQLQAGGAQRISSRLQVIAFQAEMIDRRALRTRRADALSARKQFEKLCVGDAQIDQPQRAVVAVEPHHLGKTQRVPIEGERPLDVGYLQGDVPDALQAQRHSAPPFVSDNDYTGRKFVLWRRPHFPRSSEYRMNAPRISFVSLGCPKALVD